MTKTEFLKKWIPEAEKFTHIIGINYMYRAMGDDLDELIAWASDNVIKGSKGDYMVFSEAPKETDGIWTATAELRWKPMHNPHQPITKLLQQKWINYTEIKIQWRTVPTVNE